MRFEEGRGDELGSDSIDAEGRSKAIAYSCRWA